MKKLIALTLTLALLLPGLASAAGVVNVFNWDEYIDESVLQQFTEETGIEVNYMRFTTNEDMIVLVEANPGSFDVVFPSDYLVERLLNKGLLEELDYSRIPNAEYILPNLRDPAYDPEGAHSVPYMWGTVGILYNKTMVEEPVDSWGILWDEKYSNNVFMMDSMRDCLGVALIYLGKSMNTREYPDLLAATQLLIQQKTSGITKAYQVDETKDKMIAGEGALAVMWSGDAQYAIDRNEDLAYVVPKEGSNVWVDAMVIIRNARNLDNAYAFINFLCRPDIAVLNCEEIRYSSPNSGAIELMGEEYTSNATLNPDDETLARCEYFVDIPDNYREIYNNLWLQVKSTR